MTWISLPSSSMTFAVTCIRAQSGSAREASSNSAGRMPRMISRPKKLSRSCLPATRLAGSGRRWPAKVTAGPSSRTSSALTKFIAGDPMNPATNRFTGAVVERLWRVHLLQLAVPEHADPVPEGHRLHLVVRDVHGGDGQPVVQLAQ